MKQELTLREAQLKEAARELLQLSRQLHPEADHRARPMHAAAALAALVTGDPRHYASYVGIADEVEAEEARG